MFFINCSQIINEDTRAQNTQEGKIRGEKEGPTKYTPASPV